MCGSHDAGLEKASEQCEVAVLKVYKCGLFLQGWHKSSVLFNLYLKISEVIGVPILNGFQARLDDRLALTRVGNLPCRTQDHRCAAPAVDPPAQSSYQ